MSYWFDQQLDMNLEEVALIAYKKQYSAHSLHRLLTSCQGGEAQLWALHLAPFSSSGVLFQKFCQFNKILMF